MRRSVLVAGVGNVFHGDDGFGVSVVEELARRPVPPGVEVRDYGIRALHLAYELIEPLELLVLVDALPRGREPGTIYVFEPDLHAGERVPRPDAHGLDVNNVFATARMLGAKVPTTRIVGCEPLDLDEGMGLSDVVEASVPSAAEVVRDLVARFTQTAGRRSAKEIDR